MSTTTIAGKPSNTIGEKDSTLVLRGSSIKIQWGNKFIDLIKNGKINSDSQKLLKTADSTEELTTDGLYLVGDSVWAIIGGTKVQLSGDSTTTYVSYLTEQKDVTGEQKERALTNIGFYYETLEEANAAGLTSGIIYVKGDNKLYIVKDRVVSEYGMTLNNSQNTEETEKILEKLYIQDYSLMVDGEEYVLLDNDKTIFLKQVQFNQIVQSENASPTFGYRLYTREGQSYLEIDNLIVRNNNNQEELNTSLYPIKYYARENLILKASKTETSSIEMQLLKNYDYNIGDILTTTMIVSVDLEDSAPLSQLLSVDFIIENITDGIITSKVVIDEVDEIEITTEELETLVMDNINQLVNKNIFYKRGNLPVARISDYNYDLFKPNTNQTLGNINLRIGSLQELEVSLLGKKISEYTKEDLGIYSDNAFLKNSYLFNSSQYNTVFKNYNNIYPKYDEGWFIPDTSDDQTIVTSLWVNNKIEPIWTEINVIKESIKSIEDLEDRLDQAESDIDELEKSVKNLEDSLDSLGDSIPDVSGLISDVSTLKSNVTTITTNVSTLQTDLDSAESKITTAETAISTLKTDVSNLKNADISINNEIDDIWEEIDNITDSSNTANLQEQIDELTSRIEELSLLPKILISGTVYRDSADSLSWKFTGVLDRTIAESGDVYNYITAMPLTTSINGGVLKIDWTNSRYTNIVACSAQMQTSGKVISPTSGEYKSTDGDKAMYWFGTYSDGNSTYIRAMTQADQNNDTAISYDELWGPVNESHKYGILAFSIIATGYKM